MTTRLLAAAGALLAATSLAACSHHASASKPKPHSSPSDEFSRALAFSQCMRSHGVPKFPDPSKQGGNSRITIGDGVDPNSPEFRSAQQACQSLQPGGTSADAGAVDATKIGPWTQCMRGHGLPNFPDPQVSGGNLKLDFSGTGINPQSPAFQDARTACQSTYPGGGVMMSGAGS